jgi:hypothetical protein
MLCTVRQYYFIRRIYIRMVLIVYRVPVLPYYEKVNEKKRKIQKADLRKWRDDFCGYVIFLTLLLVSPTVVLKSLLELIFWDLEDFSPFIDCISNIQ